MRRWCAVCLFGVVVASGCSKERNPRACLDGICPDLAYPFCDIDGSLEGSPKTCIAVDCEPQSLVACRGNEELRCNTDGTNYSIFQCSRGCEDATGCRLCDPNETACTNGKLATCDASGAVVSAEACPLGCFEDQPRCREIAPSNGLGTYLDMVADPPDVVLNDAVFYPDTGVVLNGSTPAAVPSFLVPPVGNGVAIRVFIFNSLRVTSGTVELQAGDERTPAGAGIALVGRHEIQLTGELVVHSRAGSALTGCAAGAGNSYDDGQGRYVGPGGGGGGNATTGPRGGHVVNGGAGGAMDQVSGTADLVPLRGGCSGGFTGSTAGSFPTGGGAIQVSSGARIIVNGTLDVRGKPGELEQDGIGSTVGGGGAGGSILLEAPEIHLGASAKLLATGGDGAQACATPSSYCGGRGLGATTGLAATPGSDVQYTNTLGTIMTGGGGGGGLGRIRINTPDQTYTKSSGAVEAGALSTGTLSSR